MGTKVSGQDAREHHGGGATSNRLLPTTAAQVAVALRRPRLAFPDVYEQDSQFWPPPGPTHLRLKVKQKVPHFDLHDLLEETNAEAPPEAELRGRHLRQFSS